MDKKLLGAGMALLIAGCASVEMAHYTVTSFPEVILKKDAKVQIVANDDSVAPIVEEVKKGFSENGAFSVVDEGADYWFILTGQAESGVPCVRTVASVVKEPTADGTQDIVSRVEHNLSSAAKIVSVAVYEVKSLAPVYYFEIPVWDGDNKAEAARGDADYMRKFAIEVVERFNDVFLTQNKEVETPIPLEADGNLRKLFSKGDYKNFIVEYKKTGVLDISAFCAKVRAGKYEAGDQEQKLGNYYLYLLVKESLSKDPGALEVIKGEHMEILRTSKADGLVEAVPVALARLEYKLANVE